jgi:hypothetical protein
MPRWDYTWQQGFWMTEPLTRSKGNKLLVIAHLDNSSVPSINVDPTKRLAWSDQTWDEMMRGFSTRLWTTGRRRGRQRAAEPTDASDGRPPQRVKPLKANDHGEHRGRVSPAREARTRVAEYPVLTPPWSVRAPFVGRR